MRLIVTDRVAWSVGLSVTLVSPAKTAEPIEIQFGLSARMGPRNRVLDGSLLQVLRDVTMATVFVFYIWGIHWRHMANTTEPSVCGGDAALFQITLTTF